MPHLVVKKADGSLLFDTNNITYGLVKSGYMTYQQAWTRKTLRSAQLDPSDGANWFPSNIQTSLSFADGLWGFTVTNAISPIVFIVGSGTLNGSSVSGSSITFFYSNADANTKYYCFDLVSDNIAGSPYLKTFNSAGRITFNSLQPPLNIAGSYQAPVPGSLDQYGRYGTCYAGGSNRVRQAFYNSGGITYVGQVDSYIDIPLTAGVEYAVYLPWSRGGGIGDFMSGGTGTFLVYSVLEGAYGRVGGISFMMGASAATTQSTPNNQGWSLYASFFNIPTDRYPVALYITTTNLPFPFG
jgi:hypothetical protein